MDETESLYPIAVLINELKSEEVSKRVKALNSLSTISVALGAERTRSELLPYLSGAGYLELLDDEPPVLLELVKQLSSFSEFVGGKRYAHVLLDPLEQLTQVEDAGVRIAAVQGIVNITLQVSSPILNDIVLDLCKDLSGSETVPARSSASLLISKFFPNFSKPSQSEAVALFTSLSKDDSGIVRKAASENFGLLAQVAGLSTFDILTSIAGEKEDGIRASAVSGIVAMASALSQQKRNSLLLPMLRALSEDKAPRVRYSTADHLHELAHIFGSEVSVQVLSPVLMKLLQDSEAQVRATTCTHLSEFLICLNQEQVASIVLPAVSALATDVDVVKIAFTAQISPISAHVGAKHTRDFLLPSLITLLKDESTDVKLPSLKAACGIITLLSADDLEHVLLPALEAVARDKAWRTRLQFAELLPEFARKMGSEAFHQSFRLLILRFLTDNSFSVRDGVIHKLTEIAEIFGQEWTDGVLAQGLLQLQEYQAYTVRVTLMKTISLLIPLSSLQSVKTQFLPLIEENSKDVVPHVRLNAAQAASSCKILLPDEDLGRKLNEIGNRLKQDADPDVRFFAEALLLSVVQS